MQPFFYCYCLCLAFFYFSISYHNFSRTEVFCDWNIKSFFFNPFTRKHHSLLCCSAQPPPTLTNISEVVVVVMGGVHLAITLAITESQQPMIKFLSQATQQPYGTLMSTLTATISHCAMFLEKQNQK